MVGKIRRANKKFGVDGRLSRDLDAALVRRWNGIGHEEMGVRAIANWFNRKVLEIAYDDAGLSTLDSRIQSDYEALTDDDEMVRESVEIELESEGVDPQELRDKYFVSGPTVYRYLTDHIGAEKESQKEESEWEEDAIEYQIDKLKTAVKEAMSSLDTKGEVSVVGDVEPEVRIYVEDECGRTTLTKALNQGYICQSGSEDSDSNEDTDPEHDRSGGRPDGSIQAKL